MKKTFVTMMAAAMVSTAFAGPATTIPDIVTEPQDFKRLSGALHMGVGTAYTMHGYVVSRPVIQGEGYGMSAVQIAYDFGKEGLWSYTGALSYKVPFSGHTLYGNPKFPQTIPGTNIPHPYAGHEMGYKNVEDEFLVRNGLKYTREKWNVALGHDFIHGGIPGVVSKHFDGNDHSYLQQGFLNVEVTPVAWFSADVNVNRVFDNMDGWWFETHARFKAPIIGSPEDIKLAGILELGMSWAANFYESSHNACSNGTQAFWVKLSTPWFVNEEKNFILTPSVSWNWLGKGGMKANERSAAKVYGNQYKPFRNFAVVGDLTATYKF